VSHDRVAKANQSGRVEQGGRHCAPFCDGTSNDTRDETCKGELKEKILKQNTIALQEKAGAPNVRRAAVVVATVGKRISGRPKGKTSPTRVEKVRQDNILGVLGSDRAGSEHSKACLHKVDESSLLCGVPTELADKILCMASCRESSYVWRAAENPTSTYCKDKEKGIDTRRNIGRFEKYRLPEETSKIRARVSGLVLLYYRYGSLTKQAFTYCFLSIGDTLQKPVGVVAGVLDCQFALSKD
jgi:hypothetical protein